MIHHKMLYYPHIDNSNWLKDYGAIIASIISSSVALALGAGLGEYLKKRKWKPDLKFVTKLHPVDQNYEKINGKTFPSLRIWRIPIRNDGNEIAKGVRVDVVKIKEGETWRKNFIPIPLDWMHHNQKEINILPEKTEYIDVLKLVLEKEPWLQLATSFATNIPDFIKINKGETSIYIRVFEERGKTLPTLKIVVDWNGKPQEVKIKLVKIV